VGTIEQQIIELAKQGYGRPTILKMLEGQATDWQVRTVLGQLRSVAENLDEDEKERLSRNVRPSHFDVVTNLHPIEIKVPRNRKSIPEGRTSQKVIFVGDTHAPFEDKRAVDLACQIITDEAPDILVHLGDLVDFYSISRFEKDPNRRLLLQDELEAAAYTLGQLDQAVSTKTRKILFRGNHEVRIDKYIHGHAPALAGLDRLKIPNLLGLKSLGWEYVKHDLELFPEFLIKHGEIVRQNAGYSARGEMDRAWMSGISGHTHRLALFSYMPRRAYLKEQQSPFWIENGCLCTLAPEYMEGNGNWQQGFTILHVYDEIYVPEFVNITHGRAVHRGKLYKG
jgi:predicted phosphodiesterase